MSRGLLEKMKDVFAQALLRSEEPELFDKESAIAAGVPTRSGVVAGQAVPDPTNGQESEPVAKITCPLQQLQPSKIIVLI